MDPRIASNILQLLQPEAQRALMLQEAMHALQAEANPAPPEPPVAKVPQRKHAPSLDTHPAMIKPRS